MTDQLDIFGATPARLARKRDPATSHEAAGRVAEFAQNHYEVIVGALKRFGPLTVDQIALRTRLLSQQVNKRTVELQRQGLIDTTGETRLSASGRSARVWRAL